MEMLRERSVSLEAQYVTEWPKVPQLSLIAATPVKDDETEPREQLSLVDATADSNEAQPTSCSGPTPTELKGNPKSDNLNGSDQSEAVEPPKTQLPERRWLNLGRFTLKKSLWPEPHLSLGTKCNRMGDNDCWEAIGPAQALFAEILKPIGELLDTRTEEIEEGEPVAGNILTYGMYMIGRDLGTARPTLVFTCRRPKPRRRAIKFVKESGILKGHPKIALAQSSFVPMALGRNYLEPLAAATTSILQPRSSSGTPSWFGPVLGSILGLFSVTLTIVVTLIWRRRHLFRSNTAAGQIENGTMDNRRWVTNWLRSTPADAKAPTVTTGESTMSPYEDGRHEMAEVQGRQVYEMMDTSPLASFPAAYPFARTRNTVFSNDASDQLPEDMGHLSSIKCTTLYGMPVSSKATSKAATIGGVLVLKNKFYGLTVRHAFVDARNAPSVGSVDDAPVDNNDDHEFSFDSDEEDEIAEMDISDATITSQASISSAASTSRISSTSSSGSKRQENTVSSFAEVDTSHKGKTPSISPVGRIFTDPTEITRPFVTSTKAGHDWALIQLSETSVRAASLGEKLTVHMSAPNASRESLTIGALERMEPMLARIYQILDDMVKQSVDLAQTILSAKTNVADHWARLTMELRTEGISAEYIRDNQDQIRKVLCSIVEANRLEGYDANEAALEDESLRYLAVPKGLAEKPTEVTNVVAIKGFSGISRGTMSPSITMMMLPQTSKFHEVWTVRLDSPLVEGDSGSWVIDSVTGDLYGHVVAGVPGSGLAFILPAERTFKEIEEVVGPIKLVSKKLGNHFKTHLAL